MLRSGAISRVRGVAAARPAVGVRSVAATPSLHQEAAAAPAAAPVAPPVVTPAAASAPRDNAAAPSGDSSSRLHYSREELAALTLQHAQTTWALKQDELVGDSLEYNNVLALAQNVVPNTAAALSTEGGGAVPSSFLENPISSINNGQVGYWRPMARLLLLKENLSAADLANPAPYGAVSYEEAETLLVLDEASLAEQQEKEEDARQAAMRGTRGTILSLAAKEDGKQAINRIHELLGMDKLDLSPEAIAKALAEAAAAAGGDAGKQAAAASEAAAAKQLEASRKKLQETFSMPLLEALEVVSKSGPASVSVAASGDAAAASAGASEAAGAATIPTSTTGGDDAAAWIDTSPPITGALTFMRLRGNPASSSASADSAEEAVIEGALAAGAGHPSPNMLHPLATLWVTATVRYLETTRQRLGGYIEGAKAMVRDRRPGSTRDSLAAVGLDLATSEVVLSSLSSVPMMPLSADHRKWLKSLSVDQLDALLTALAMRRRGITTAGADVSTAAAVDASPLAQRIKSIDGAIAALNAAKNGQPLKGGAAAASHPHLVRYPSVRQLHSSLLQAAATVPGFSESTSAAAARLAQYAGVVALEATRLQEALRHASAAVQAFGGQHAASVLQGATSTAVQGFDASASSASITVGDLTISRQLVDPATKATTNGNGTGDAKASAASLIVAKQLNAGHLPTLLQPLSFILSPAEWTGLVTTALVAAPCKEGYIAHPPQMGAFNAISATSAAGAAGASDGEAASNGGSGVMADDATLEQTSSGAAATRGLKSLMLMQAAGAKRLEDAFKSLENKLKQSNGSTAAVDKLRRQVEFAQRAAASGAFDGRTASMAQVLETLLETARAAQATSGAGPLKQGISPAYADDVPALIKWFWSRANAASPEAMLEGRESTFRTLNQSLSEVAAVAELSHMVNDAAAAAFSVNSSVYSFGSSQEDGPRLTSLTQVIPLPLEAASGLPLPSLIDHNGRVIRARAGDISMPSAQPIVDPGSSNPLSAMWPTPSVAHHQYYPPSKADRVAAVPRGDGLPALVPRVRSLPPELSVTSVYGETAAPNVPAATRVIDEFIASKALEESQRTGKTVSIGAEGINAAVLLRRNAELRASEVSILASDTTVGTVVDAAIQTLLAGKADSVSNAEEGPSTLGVEAGPLGIGAGSDTIPPLKGPGSVSTSSSASANGSSSSSSVVNVDASAFGVAGAGNADAAKPNGFRIYGETAELALSAINGEADIATEEAMGGLPVLPSANPARTRAAKLEALVSAVIRTAKAKAAAYNAEHGLGESDEEGGPAAALAAAGDKDKGGIAGHITPELVKQVEIALASGTGVPVVKEDGTVILVDPETGGQYSAGAALQWRNYEYQPNEHYRGKNSLPPAPTKRRRFQPASEAGGEGEKKAAKSAIEAEEEAVKWALYTPYEVVHRRIAEAMEARDLGAVWTLFTEHKRMMPQEGDPDFLLYEMVMDACARAKRADLLFEVLWPEVCRLRMVVTDAMVFLLFKGACLSVGPQGTPEHSYLAKAETIFKHQAESVVKAAVEASAEDPITATKAAGGLSRSWYVALISACLEADEPTKAFHYFAKLKRAGYESDASLYSHMAAKLTEHGMGEEMHHLWRTLLKSPNLTIPKWLYTQLIVSFARLGNIQDMEACRERMSRRIDRNQKPEPLARSAMLDAYLAAGMIESAKDVLAELQNSKEVQQLSVALQCKLSHSVQAKLREAQAALDASGSAKADGPRFISEGGRNGDTGGGYVFKGVADSCIQGLVAAYSRPQVVPEEAHSPAASLVPAYRRLSQSAILPGLLSVPAPGVKHDTLATEEMVKSFASASDAASNVALSRIYESGAELYARASAEVEEASRLVDSILNNASADGTLSLAIDNVSGEHEAVASKKRRGALDSDEDYDSEDYSEGDEEGGEEEAGEDVYGGLEDEEDEFGLKSSAFGRSSKLASFDTGHGVAFSGTLNKRSVEATAVASIIRSDPAYRDFLVRKGIGVMPESGSDSDGDGELLGSGSDDEGKGEQAK